MTTMDFSATLAALRRLRVETGSLVCFGCGHEHNCSTHGCAILRNAVEHMEAALSNYDSLSALVHHLETELKSEILSAAELRARMANEWVSVEERLPEVYLDEEDIGIPFLVCGPYTKYPFRAFFAGTFWHDCFEPVEVTHWMPLPAPPDRRPPEGEEERHGD